MNETTWQSLGLDHLPVTDKIHVVEKLWADLNAEVESQPVPASHVDELRRRVAESNAAPDEGTTWEHVKAEIESER